MRRAESIVNAFLPARESCDTAFLAQIRHTGFATGENLVPVGLVANIPYQTIFRRVEHIVQRDGDLDRAEVRRKVTSSRGHRVNDVFAQFFGKCRKIASIQSAQICRVINLVEQRVFIHLRFSVLPLNDESCQFA